MALSADELLSIRQTIGDVIEQPTGGYILSDDTLQAIYDDRGGALVDTYIVALQRIVGVLRNKIDVSTQNTAQNSRYSQLFEQAKDLLDYWLNHYLMYGSSLFPVVVQGIGFLDLGLDEGTSSDTARGYMRELWY